jgi:PKD repeat protein
MLMIFTMIFCISAAAGTVGAADTGNNTTVISSNSNVTLAVANDNGTRFNTSSNTTYTFFGSSQAGGGGGLNPLHISSNSNASGGDVTFTNKTSGTFYLSDTGGQGNWDDGILMIAVNGTIPDDFSITITSSGYIFTPVANGVKPSLDSLTYQAVALNETFTKEDFIYGPQTWKPCPTSNYPIYEYQDMSNTNNMFYILFIDLYAGIIGTSTPGYDTLINNGMLQVNYTINGLPAGSLLAFDAYAYKMYSNHPSGVLATNRVNTNVLNDSTSSGYYVNGIGAFPIANFSASNPDKSTTPFTVQFNDGSNYAVSWLWDFGDNQTSTEQNPIHNYSSPGNYSVKLTVTNAQGSDEKTINVTVGNFYDVLANLAEGLYNATQTVSLTAKNVQDPNPKIYYTLDDSTPTTSSTLYDSPISIDKEGITVLKFIAVDASGNISGESTVKYTIDKSVPVPSASLSSGTYNTRQTVTLNATDNLDSNPKIYYTLDSSTPTTSSTLYNDPISIYKVGTNTLKFIAVDDVSNISPVYNVTYNMVDIKAPVASVNLPSGTYQTDQVVDLSSTDEMDPNPKIYYTLDGTDPTINSSIYTWPISIGNEGTNILKFIAVDAAGHTSNIVMRIYTLDKPSASGTWSSTTLDSNIWGNSLAMDSLNNSHIAYSTVPYLKYAYKNGTGWQIETVDTSTYGASCVSLALDSSNNPHIVYFDLTTYTLKYAYKDGTGWHISNLADNENILSVDMVLYHNEPIILFYSKKEGKLRYMYYNSTWVIEDVAPVSTGGRWNSLALDSAGVPYISFYCDTGSSGYLGYAKKTVKGAWHISVVDNSAYAGQWNSLALDFASSPCISYRGSDGSLKYAYWNGTQWVIDSVSDLESVDNELVLDSLGNPYIVYQDFITGNLKYAYKDGNWTCTNLDTVDGTSGFISLALNSSGIPNVSYTTANSGLKYANLVPFVVSADPGGGSYESVQNVNLTSTSETTIYYTTDGTDPRLSNSKIKYSDSIPVNNTTTLKFAAVDSASNWSNIYTETYSITDFTDPTVTVDPVGSTYNTSKIVTLTATDVNPTKIYYTTDGSNPKSSSTKKEYTSPVPINTTTTLMFTAVDAVGNWGPVYIEKYTILTVSANNPGGNYYSPQNVVLAASETSDIYYTLDGSDPTKSSAKYSNPINIGTSRTLKFTAWDSAGNQSQIHTEKYFIYAWMPYSYPVTIQYRLSNKKYRIKYRVAYKVKRRIRTKIGKRWKYKWTYVTKYRWKYRWDYRYGYRTETRWSNHWVLT